MSDTATWTAPPAYQSESQLAPDGVEFRSLVPRDTDFIADSWLRCYQDSGGFLHRIERGRYRNFLLPVVAEILGSPSTTVRVAASESDPLIVVGYSIFSAVENLIHMVYVRKGWRRLGIGRRLLSGVSMDGAAFSTATTDLRAWIQKKIALGEYKPFWLREVRDGSGS